MISTEKAVGYFIKLDYEDDFRSGCQNFCYQQQFVSKLPSPVR